MTFPATDWCYVPRSASSSPEPDNNNDLAGLIKKGGLDPNFIPDPKCGVDIRCGPDVSGYNQYPINSIL